MFRFDALFQGGVHAHSLLTSSIHAHTLFAICFCSLRKAREVKTERERARDSSGNNERLLHDSAK